MNGLIKCFTSIGAIFILLFGIAMLGGSIFLMVKDSIFLGNSSLKWTVTGILAGVAIFIIGGAAEGIYGICKVKPKLICCFQIFVIFFMILFIGMGILAAIAPNIVFNG